MLPEVQTPRPSVSCGPYVPIPHRVANNRDAVIRELRQIWPSAVDLAKEPGVLYRLHALLNI
ncbi:MAG: hypothetical protein WBB85_16455 [Albidovulum sp.]|uniref:hypothetical protein n=1 Tax=Albidovulum sp. TaxID=1872424 RepID=UPI003C82896A